MSNAKEIKNRINSIKDTYKITNAMYLIASTKLRKAKAELMETNPYFHFLRLEARKILQGFENIESRYLIEDEADDEYNENDNRKTGILVITADKGLAGTYNQNVIKKTNEIIKAYKNYEIFAVGEYGRTFFSLHGYNMNPDFLFTAQNPDMDRARQIASILIEKFLISELSRIFIVYTELENGMNYYAEKFKMLPLNKSHFTDYKSTGHSDIFIDEKYEYVPSGKVVLETIIPNYLTGFIYSSLVDSYCSEQNARMMAMDSANSNAKDLLGELNLKYNHIRQSAITQEITEISSGAKSLRMKKESLL